MSNDPILVCAHRKGFRMASTPKDVPESLLAYQFVGDTEQLIERAKSTNRIYVVLLQGEGDPSAIPLPPSALVGFHFVGLEGDVLVYEREVQTTPHDEHVYLDLLQDILDHGSYRKERTGTGALSVFGRQMRFSIRDSMPLLTTKFVPCKAVLHELLWFLRGATSSKDLEEKGVNIWRGNTTRDFLDKRGLSHYEEGDCGPMYGFQLLHFGADYTGCGSDYADQGHDQLAEVINLLKTDPFSRRILMTTYNVADRNKGVLYPCHGIVIQFFCEEDNDGHKHLSCHMYQRSMDVFLGAPFNIASYAALTQIIAAKTEMIPKELVISTGDTHLYSNLVDQAKLQLTRTPYPFPRLVFDGAYVTSKDWNELCVDDFRLEGYIHHPTIKGEMSV